jgi:TrwC relaxase
MSMHKLTAGSGYDYLTRKVAALDSTQKGHTGLASYYAERGETPGVWIGSGMNGIDGLTIGDPVTAEQMRALFGCGLHPLAELRQQQLEGPDLTQRDYQDAARLGRRSGSLTATSARSATKWQDASRQSRRRPACRPALLCRLLIGRGCGPKWPGSSSCPSMAGSRLAPGNWRDRSRRTPDRKHRRSRALT